MSTAVHRVSVPLLDRVLAPGNTETFVSAHWQQRHLFCRGTRTRFDHLLTWSAFNRILEHHWREPFRFRLASAGRELAPSAYADVDADPPRLRSEDLTEHLRRGATLAFHGADEVHTPLRRLAEAFETTFRADTQINVYAAWRAVHGLDVHRDDEEVFVLHLQGRKRWLLYGAEAPDLRGARWTERSLPPTGALFDETLEPGDFLYVPLGCYHAALPMNEPTLHLTIGTRAASGVKEGGGKTGADRSRAAADIGARPSFALPWSAAPDGLPVALAESVHVEWHGPAPEIETTDPPALTVHSRGRTYRFPISMRTIITILVDRGPVSLDVIRRAGGGTLDTDAVRTLVSMLLQHGLVSIVE